MSFNGANSRVFPEVCGSWIWKPDSGDILPGILCRLRPESATRRRGRRRHLRGRRRQSVGGLGHCPAIDHDRERRKDRWSKPPSRRSLKMPLTRSPYSRSSRPVAGNLPGYDRLLSLGARHVHLGLRNHPIPPGSVAASLVRRASASSKREAGAENGWTKRPALWLRAIKDKTEMAKFRALGGKEEDLPKVGSVAFEI